jgi:hypothetical protein
MGNGKSDLILQVRILVEKWMSILKTIRIWPTGYHGNDCRNLAYFVPIEVEIEKTTERERRLCILKAPQEVIKGQCPARCLVSK